MARVLFVNHTSRLGGAEKVLLNYLSQLQLHGTGQGNMLAAPEGPLLTEARVLGVTCFPLVFEEMRSTRTKIRATDIARSVRMYSGLRHAVRQSNPDLLCSNSVKAHVLTSVVSRQLKIPLVIRLHDQLRDFSPISRRVIKGSMLRAALVSCVSQSVADDASEMLNDNRKVKVCYNGVIFRSPQTRVHSVKRQIVTAGWMFHWKGFDVFVKAMEKIADQAPEEWEFVIAGDVAQDVKESYKFHQQLIQLVECSKWKNRFLLVGSYEELSDILCCAEHSIFVLPSQKPDPLPTVILEAATLGVPVVATNLGGAREIIANGQNGILTEATADSIADGVLALLRSNQLRLEYGSQLRATVLEQFSVSDYARKLGDDISGLLAVPERY